MIALPVWLALHRSTRISFRRHSNALSSRDPESSEGNEDLRLPSTAKLCHPDRSAAEWRELRWSLRFAPRRYFRVADNTPRMQPR